MESFILAPVNQIQFSLIFVSCLKIYSHVDFLLLVKDVQRGFLYIQDLVMGTGQLAFLEFL